MSVRNELGLSRQIFFCQIGSFDTHGEQKATQQALLGQLSQAVSAFYEATQEPRHRAKTSPTFTASEFGRTLTPSGSDGSDHAWGSHHFILGGGVQGGKIYGTLPIARPGVAPMMPTTAAPSSLPRAISQYGATLAQWFGVSSAHLPGIFPNIANFALVEPRIPWLSTALR